ncbi:HD domain-containing protein [Paenibacillus sp. J2TS4]|uniref:HD domain-containing protein n=1 Tax=Paenibacillus sp. J2TS4 TaxID=2807194 RepID=UPI001B090114|nr:HD domain-containing protein [Paenibacillus sp. J2TS4]GIP34709.1 hypothetical protein J2TS4_39190 [Paenibacillus sp. J2TS4]
MDIEKIKEVAMKTMSRRKSHLQRERGFIFYHGQRVANMAIHLRKSLFPEDSSKDDIIYVGALFHDVAKGIEPHGKMGAQLIPHLLNEYCTAQELEQISEVVALHNARQREGQPFYVKLVQDADVLDHFGSLEIWLKFMYSAHTEENVFDAVALWDSKEHQEYIENSRALLNYDLSQKIYDDRIEFERTFQERFALECNGEIFY